MFKFIFRILLLVLIGVIGLVVYAVYTYRLVRTDEGYHLLHKESRSFSPEIIDTRDWNALDYLRNGELTKKLTAIRWESWQERLNDQWSQLSESLDDFGKDLSLPKENPDFQNELEQLEQSLRGQYEHLKKRLRDGDLDLERFREEMAKLKDEAKKSLETLREKIPANP